MGTIIQGMRNASNNLQSSSMKENEGCCYRFVHKISTTALLILGVLIAAGGAVVLALLCTLAPLSLSCAGIALIALGAVILGMGLTYACKCCFQSRMERLLVQESKEMSSLKESLLETRVDIKNLVEENISAQQTNNEIVQSLLEAFDKLTGRYQAIVSDNHSLQAALEQQVLSLQERCQILEEEILRQERLLQQQKPSKTSQTDLAEKLQHLKNKYKDSLILIKSLNLELSELKVYCADLQGIHQKLVISQKENLKKDEIIKELKVMIAHYAKICDERGLWIEKLKEANKELLCHANHLARSLIEHKKLCLGERLPTIMESADKDEEDDDSDTFGRLV
ncbi:hypothetical protein [Chlamydia sp.]|uniref:hypothetical protein n=1 Tax=Chlamydia sp. TaxID=35827 RepID=UPI0025C6A052|nr:hypothetical protein [Chlamydia sp.]MBQ8499055.1 hypothetical protein [Chlamydia sp.]